MSDYLLKSVCYEGQIRAYALCATETVSEAQKRHDTWSASSAALGRTMVGALLLGATLKGDDKMTVKVDGDGPVGHIVVDSNGRGEVKGYIANPSVSLPPNAAGKIDVRGAVGTQGTLTVTKDLGLKEAFSGQVPLVSGELGEDFTYYMANSEQVPSAIGLSVLVDTDDSIKAAGGFMIQVMPGATDETLLAIEKNIAEIPLVSKLMDAGEQPEEILNRLLGKENVKVLEKMPVSFKCDCSKERFSTAIIALGEHEITEMIEEDHGAEASCHFCGNHYHYSETDLIELRAESLAK
ncbi:Hsp33 family molecular chaperone HslO [Carnobacterium divergens]|uniref:33 kDa chaperonin n=1 Tax=Carnobacterium divergens TaxID=2748 RepID=A0A7Z8CXT5_CARDV|nr:Hsp33 family molecular chaperone HslO [Carnobacterium divergens]TFI71821.1 redox-regulated molecular chaperone Hsp33 [Carnobacterium divergens]TFI76670.1 redox-regulated molecular chaperone Hsp33 [Carnobacterium divergens]TFI82498.1 redox-regulated molecular chaperone Hsp33 [Carnobacterium divergens]TFI94670.1 redox-regulated molecular chaperone Hsp33 [Carnobacterium divergens]TFJ11189.1 redox-regulated molecular chaperone Hsp33 [Carnobacterium divergens]